MDRWMEGCANGEIDGWMCGWLEGQRTKYLVKVEGNKRQQIQYMNRAEGRVELGSD